MKHDLYDKYFEPATAIQAEGARIGIATCKECGAAVLLDPRDKINRARQHGEWHEGKAELERVREWCTKDDEFNDTIPF